MTFSLVRHMGLERMELARSWAKSFRLFSSHRKAGHRQSSGELPLQISRGLQNHQRRAHTRKLLGQITDAGCVIGNLPHFSRRPGATSRQILETSIPTNTCESSIHPPPFTGSPTPPQPCMIRALGGEDTAPLLGLGL